MGTSRRTIYLEYNFVCRVYRYIIEGREEKNKVRMAFAVRTKPFRSLAMSHTTLGRIVNRSRHSHYVGSFYSTSILFLFLSLFVAPPLFRMIQDWNSSRRYTRILVPRDIKRSDIGLFIGRWSAKTATCKWIRFVVSFFGNRLIKTPISEMEICFLVIVTLTLSGDKLLFRDK